MVAEMVHHDVELDFAVLKVAIAFLNRGDSFGLHDILDGDLSQEVLDTLGVLLPCDFKWLLACG